jgi:CheY-like chemotaxis protein
MVFEPHFHTLEVSSGEEAIQIVRQRPVDIALLDMHMHELSGLETLRIVKSLNALLPCIIITADATEDLRRHAALADAYSVLKKPVTKSELVTTVSTALVDAYNADPFE